MMGLNPDGGRFMTFILLNLLASLVTTSISITISAFAPDINVANLLAPGMQKRGGGRRGIGGREKRGR